MPEVSSGKGTGQGEGVADLGAAHRPATCVKGSESRLQGCPVKVSCGKGRWAGGFLTFSEQEKEAKKSEGSIWSSANAIFHLAFLCKSGFLSLTLNYLILSGGSCLCKTLGCSADAWGGCWSAGPGGGRPDSKLGRLRVSRVSRVSGGSKRSCENRLGCLCWPSSNKNCSQACSQAGSFQRV